MTPEDLRLLETISDALVRADKRGDSHRWMPDLETLRRAEDVAVARLARSSASTLSWTGWWLVPDTTTDGATVDVAVCGLTLGAPEDPDSEDVLVIAWRSGGTLFALGLDLPPVGSDERALISLPPIPGRWSAEIRRPR